MTIPARHYFTDAEREGVQFGPGICSYPISLGGYCAKRKDDEVHFPVVKPVEVKPMTFPTRDLLRAIGIAKNLNEPGEVNYEYARGQAELIVDLFGLSMGDERQFVFDLIIGKKKD